MTATVRVTGGAVSGAGEPGLTVFRGISYAAPPVGAHRFAAPQPVDPWDGVRPATTFGPPAPQSDALGGGAAVPGDDWLTANVWTPALDPAARLPVLVWIHGGAYVVGMSSWPEFDGAHLARTGGIVVVTVNYRLGVEGFALVTGETTLTGGATHPAPVNRGLLDLVAALRWVRDNVAAFGGDPGRVTIAGESAGAGCVAALLAMPAATGLFRAAIAQSVPGPFFTPALAADIATAVAAQVDCTPTAAALSAVDPARLAAAGDAVTAAPAGRWGPAATGQVLFAPVVDGDTLPATPWQALAGGAARDVALLAGHTRDEQRLLTMLAGLLGRITAEQAAAALDMFAPGPDGAGRYRAAFPEAGPERLYELVLSDWLFRMPSLRLADAHVTGGGRTHLYELTWPAPGLGGVLGACHGLDLPLMFGNLTRSGPAQLLGDAPGPDAVALSARMTAAWIAFVRDGDPGWPAYTPAEQLTQVFDTPGAVTAYPEQAARQIWQSHPFAPLTLT
ncbi:carboxylesterase/lipase family protein [Actinoplanes palleronii]|uniref:Carboxylic ester hydrolase n=1 Tax=Actinoplanes palleronii TaxID=113570 RepID=A0ABQ4BAD8_9ACTN|nr:carboxylesterase family protein [Actinoplanes palleronii]GIE67225.1 carboxylic ester hydrolase [Actinoplanes palleronii]